MKKISNKIYLISKHTINKLFILLFLFVTVVNTGYVLASNLTSQKQGITAEINKQQTMVKELEEQQKNISQEALNIQNEINSKENEINNLEAEASELADEIEEMERKAEEFRTSQEKTKEILKKRLRALYMNGNLTYVEMMLQSENVIDFFTNYNMVKKIADIDSKLVSNAEQEKQKLEALASELETKKKRVEEKENQIKKAKTENEELKKKKDAEVAKLSEQGKQALAKIDELKKEEQKIANQIAEYERRKRLEMEKARKQGNTSGAKFYEKYVGGVFAWPAPGSSRVTTLYGKKGSVWSSGYHTGIDMAGPAGSRIVAVNDGIVVMAGWNGSYGNCVILDHGGGLYTLYAHGSQKHVSAGQTVKRGQLILSMGETGNAFGVHLHFEVRKGSASYSSHVNPAPYLGM